MNTAEAVRVGWRRTLGRMVMAELIADVLERLASAATRTRQLDMARLMTRRRNLMVPAGMGVTVVLAKVVLSWPQVQSEFALAAITWVVVASFATVGVVLLASDLPAVNGWTCLVVAATTVPGDLNEPAYASSGWSNVGFILEFGYIAAAVALVLRYPKATLLAAGRWLGAALIAVTMAIRIPVPFVQGPLPDGLYRTPGWPSIWAPTVHDILLVRIPHALATMLLIITGITLILRAVRSAGLARQAVFPLSVIGAVCAFAAAFDQAIWAIGLPALRPIPAATIRDLAAAALPVALIALLARRRSAAGLVADRVLAAAHSPDPTALQSALAEVLLDPSITVEIPANGGSGTDPLLTAAGVNGGPGQVGSSGPLVPVTRDVVEVSDGEGTCLARIAFNPKVIARDGLLDVAVAAAKSGLLNQALAHQVQNQLHEIQASRTRIAEAGWAERRRVERDLHDGAQQQFLAIMATLASADLVDDANVRPLLREARGQLGDALGELRRLARGIHPAVLTQGGLVAAIPSLQQLDPDKIQVTVDPHLGPGTVTPAIESAAFFVVAEAVTNAHRHADATQVRVTVKIDGPFLVATVADDGRGDAEITTGGGLAGIRDRVEALGGQLVLHRDPCLAHPHSGSTVKMTLPLPGGASV